MSCHVLPRTLTVVLTALILTAGCSKSSEPSPAGGIAGAPATTPGAVHHPEMTAAVSGNQMSVRVLLGQVVAGKVRPQDTVFIYARAPGENGEIVALIKRQAADLPLTVALDDAASVRANRRLSSLPVVVIGATISKQGDFNPRAGDLEGLSAPIPSSLKETVVIAINRVL
jgi:cytochrome c-type biogenesis protein CcmH